MGLIIQRPRSRFFFKFRTFIIHRRQISINLLNIKLSNHSTVTHTFQIFSPGIIKWSLNLTFRRTFILINFILCEVQYHILLFLGVFGAQRSSWLWVVISYYVFILIYYLWISQMWFVVNILWKMAIFTFWTLLFW